MKKTAIIIGTSHSQASCETDGKMEILRTGRWHDYLKTEHDYDVLNLSRSGVTVQQQLMVAISYFMDNPDLQFDLAIVEGRSMETAVSHPIPGPDSHIEVQFDRDTVTFSDTYHCWLDANEWKEAKFKTWEPINVMDANDRKKEEYLGYFVDYVFSYQHMIDTWSSNLALCNLLERHSKKVLWYTFNTPGEIADPDNPKNAVGRFLMNKYLLDDVGVQGFKLLTNQGGPMTEEEHYCDCGHLNPAGHKIMWHEILYPRMKNFI